MLQSMEASLSASTGGSSSIPESKHRLRKRHRQGGIGEVEGRQRQVDGRHHRRHSNKTGLVGMEQTAPFEMLPRQAATIEDARLGPSEPGDGDVTEEGQSPRVTSTKAGTAW